MKDFKISKIYGDHWLVLTVGKGEDLKVSSIFIREQEAEEIAEKTGCEVEVLAGEDLT